jgi:hypothetical protein
VGKSIRIRTDFLSSCNPSFDLPKDPKILDKKAADDALRGDGGAPKDVDPPLDSGGKMKAERSSVDRISRCVSSPNAIADFCLPLPLMAVC